MKRERSAAVTTTRGEKGGKNNFKKEDAQAKLGEPIKQDCRREEKQRIP